MSLEVSSVFECSCTHVTVSFSGLSATNVSLEVFSAFEFSCTQDTISISGLTGTNVRELILENIEIALLLGVWGFQAGGGVIETSGVVPAASPSLQQSF